MSLPAQLLVTVLLIIGAAAGGFYHGIEYQDGQQAQIDRARMEREAHAQAEFWEGQRKIVAKIGADLAREQQGRANDARAFRDKLRSLNGASLIECPSTAQPAGNSADPGNRAPSAPAAADPPVPRSDGPRFSVDGVRNWNGALALGVEQADRAAWIDGANTGADSVAIVDALQNLADNAELLGQCRAREAGWHRFARENGFVK